MRAPLKPVMTAVTLAVATTIAIVAQGWEQDQAISTSIHAHPFDRIVIEAKDDSCVIAYRLYFLAPDGGYAHADAGRNYYRFKARVSFSDGKRSFSPEFSNRAPGKRMYRWQHDTTAEGCWGAKAHRVAYVDVEGCRNRNCKVQPFE